MAILNPCKQKYQLDFDDGSGPMGILKWDPSDKEFTCETKYPIGFKDLIDVVGIIQKLNEELDEKRAKSK